MFIFNHKKNYNPSIQERNPKKIQIKLVFYFVEKIPQKERNSDYKILFSPLFNESNKFISFIFSTKPFYQFNDDKFHDEKF